MMRAAVLLALLVGSSTEALEAQPVNLIGWWPFDKKAVKQVTQPAAAAVGLEPGATSEGGDEPSVLSGVAEALKHQLRVPVKAAQQGISIAAAVVGIVCMANGEVMLFQLVVLGTFVFAALVMRNEAAAMWGASSESPLSLVTAVEAGLASTVIVFYSYDAIVLALGALVGIFIAHALEQLLVNHLGVDAATFAQEQVAFVWYSIFTLGCWGLVARKMHGKYLGVVTSFFGGALVASSALYAMQAHHTWVDCLGEVLGGADVSRGYEPLVASNTTAAVTVWGSESAVPGFTNFNLVGHVIWALCFLLGASFQFKQKAKAKEVEVGAYNNMVSIDP